MELANHSICTGCGACVKICPKGAIEYRDDSEGFPTPQIDTKKCVECGLCNKVCPVMNEQKTYPIRAAYAAQILDREALMKSSSGAMFTAFSREILRRGGVVYGCVWDKNYHAIFASAEDETGLEPMRSSKYVWSYAADMFPQIKESLEAGRDVLFTGLPCQIVGLRGYLQRDYGNLFLMDLFCNGAPSPLAFQKYLETICSHDGIDKLNLQFRDKREFGVGVHILYHGKKEKNNKHEFATNPYYYSFYRHIINRSSCYHCKLKGEMKSSDITVGDYWGIQDIHADMDIKAGVSAVLINSDKGMELFNSVRKELDVRETQLTAIARKNNLKIGNKQEQRGAPTFRDDFFVLLKTKGWKAAEKKYLMDKYRILQLIRARIPKPIIKLLERVRKQQKTRNSEAV